MASEVFFNRVPYTQRRILPYHQHDLFASNTVFGNASAASQPPRSVGTTRSGGALTFPPLYLDPLEPYNAQDPASGQHTGGHAAQQPGSFVLGSTFYHHPELNALVANHLTDASANALDGASSTGHAFLGSIFANRDGLHDDDSDIEEAAAANGADAAVAVPRPKITSEFVSLNEDLVPASLDMHGDLLPADQHPSYPFGNLFGPLGGTIAADSAIVGGGGGVQGGLASGGGNASLRAGMGGDTAATLGLDFGGGLDGFIHLGQPSHGRRGAVSNAWNIFINKASRSKLVGSAGAHTEWNVDTSSSTTPTAPAPPTVATVVEGEQTGPAPIETLRSAKKLDLTPSLLFRTNTSTVLAPPTWPFRRHGPGCTSYSALLRPSSNIFGSSPASQAVAATLGGLPASSKIINEVWSDLALEELVPLRVGETSAVRHLTDEQDPLDDETDLRSAGDKRGKKRQQSDPDPDGLFAKKIATMEADPLDLLGPVSREIRGQASQLWGTATGFSRRQDGRRRRTRRHSTYSNQSDDDAAEAEHDDPEHGYAQRDRLRYSFALPPATFSWTESPKDHELGSQDDEPSETLHIEPDGTGWPTAKRIFINEERDRLLPEVASRATGAGGAIEAYQVRGVRANQGLIPRPVWTWGDAPAEDVDATITSFATENSASRSEQNDLHAAQHAIQHSVEHSDQPHHGDGQDADDWQFGANVADEDKVEVEVEDAELQRALLMQYQSHHLGEPDRADTDDDVVQVEDALEQQYDDDQEKEEDEEGGDEVDEEVDSFGEDEAV